jgi:hypothetical protein
VKSQYALPREKAKDLLMEELIRRNPEQSPEALEKMLGK